MNKKNNIIFIIITIICVYLNQKLGQTLIYIYIFILGYIYKNVENKINVNILKISIMLIIAVLIRLFFKYIMDGSLLYDVLIVSITHTILGIGIFIIIKYICEKMKIKGNRYIDSIDNISYYIYITHYMFMIGPIRTMGLTESFVINTICTIILSYISAWLLQVIDKKIQKIIENKSIRKTEI